MIDWQKGKKRIFLRIIALITVQAFFVTNIAYAAPSGRSLFRNKRPNYKAIQKERERLLQDKKEVLSGRGITKSSPYEKDLTNAIKLSSIQDLSSIYIPATLGRITEVHESEKEGLLVLIQDLHTNPEAQFNLAKMLELLIKDYDLGLVCSEGADGEVDTSSVSGFPDYKIREKVAKVFVNSGELTGEEYLSITKYPDLPIWGIEDKDIYFENIVQFNEIIEFNSSSQVFIKQAKGVLEGLKPAIYSKRLQQLDQKETEYEAGDLEIKEYLEYLTSLREKEGNEAISSYKNILLLQETLEEEKTIDQQKILQESQNLLLNLQSRLQNNSSKKELSTLKVKATLFKEQKISPFSFYSYLKGLSLKHLKGGIDNYPSLSSYITYLAKVNSIDSTKLFNEIKEMTFNIKLTLARTEKEKLLTKSLRNINFLEGFFSLKVSNEELDYYLANKEEHKVGWFKETIGILKAQGSKGITLTITLF